MDFLRLDCGAGDTGVPQFRSIDDQVDWIMQRLAEPDQTLAPGPSQQSAQPALHWRDAVDGIVATMEREEAERAAQVHVEEQQAYDQTPYSIPADNSELIKAIFEGMDVAAANRWPDGSYDVAGGPSDRLKPHPDADGPHSSFKRKPPTTGPVTDYETYWEQNPYTGKWEKQTRYRATGRFHEDKPTKEKIYPPLMHDYKPGHPNPKVRETVRPAYPNEMPRAPGLGGYGGGGARGGGK